MDLPISNVGRADPDAAPPRQSEPVPTVDRFTIIRKIGEGGMGEVFLATHPVTGMQVAVKRLKPELVADPSLGRRFLAEARHMYHLNHPRIVRIMEVWDPPAGPYYVMEHFKAGPLSETIREGQPTDYVLTVQIARDIGSALAYAHERGILHRDLKPANVLMDSDGHASLSDFGLLRQFTTNDGVIDGAARYCEGTAPYVSPAVARGEAEDTRCDIYSFGALLYELLTGHPPYRCDNESMQETLRKIAAGPPPGIARLNPHAPANLIAVAEGCMARELHSRYAKMEDVVADLELIAEGQAPLGPHRTGSPRSHWKRYVAVLLLILISLGAAFVIERHFAAPRSTNLLSAIDLSKAASADATARPDGAVVLASTPNNPRASIVFSTVPQGDYDFVVDFTRVEGNDGLDECLSYRGHSFCWTLAGVQNTTSSFWRVGSGGFGDNPTRAFSAEWLKNGMRYESRLEVRANRVSAFLDGAKISEHPTDYSDMHFPNDDELPNIWGGRLGLSILNSKFIIHRAEVIQK